MVNYMAIICKIRDVQRRTGRKAVYFTHSEGGRVG